MSKISRDMVILVSCLIVVIICIYIAYGTYGISNDVLRVSSTTIKPACKFATDFVIVFFAPSECRKK